MAPYPKLFTAFLGISRERERDNIDINVDGEYVNKLCFVDDISITESEGNLLRMIWELDRNSVKVCLKLNINRVMFGTLLHNK